jgi:hypothetical protein
MQERIGLPSTCTVQAPHMATPQPNLVPVSLRCSRSTHNSGVSLPALTSRRCPLTVNAAMSASLRKPIFICEQDTPKSHAVIGVVGLSTAAPSGIG